MDRRVFLGLLAAAGMASLGSGIVVGREQSRPVLPPPPRFARTPRAVPIELPPVFSLPYRFFPPQLAKVPAPQHTISGLPGDGNLLALTVDDGASSEVVGLYAKYIAESGMRVTFFLNGSFSSWTDNAAVLRPLVENGQVQLANHTWSHADLTKASDAQIASELTQNGDFIRSTYGVEAAPYFRPPFGRHDDRVDRIAASVGYTTPVLWYGSLADSNNISDADLLSYAGQYLQPQSIVIGHANYFAVTRHFDDISYILKSRGIQPVTLDDVFTR